MRSLFVVGTETGVGKTVVVAALARAALAAGALPVIFKPFTTDDCDDLLIPQMSSHGTIKSAPGSKKTLVPMYCETAYQFDAPISPHVGMGGSAESVDVSDVLRMIPQLRRGARRLLEKSAAALGLPGAHPETPRGAIAIMEGTGGAMTPIRGDYCMADLIRDAAVPAVVVTTNRIGALNLSVMTAMACRDRGAAPIGFVVNCIDPDGYDPGLLAEDITKVAGVPVLAVLRAHGIPPPPARRGSMFGVHQVEVRGGMVLEDMPERIQRSCAAAKAVHESGDLDGLARAMLERRGGGRRGVRGNRRRRRGA